MSLKAELVYKKVNEHYFGTKPGKYLEVKMAPKSVYNFKISRAPTSSKYMAAKY